MSAGTAQMLEFARGVGMTLLQTLGYYLLFLILERLLPAQRNQPLRDIRFNVFYLPFYVIGTALLAPPLTALVVGQLRARYPQIFGLIPVNSWVGEGLRWFVYLAIFDFAYYWFHRAQHTFAWLWPQHKLHHSDVSLNVTTSLRHHWLEEPLRVFAMTLPMAILFDLTPAFSAGLAFALSFWGFYIHTNLNLHFGLFNRILCTPQVHRIHHSVRGEHQDRNFAAIFPVYDILFGTYVAPRRGDVPETGLSSGERTAGIWEANAQPFADWLRMLRKGTRAGAG
ncbi:MAG: sterol desaturase family protein [Betaproteobacteria bacterium]|nr:sterol desaturase family protein [Betaproteobacteria bacterium]